MRGVFLLLGTNLNDRRSNLAAATDQIGRRVGEVIDSSSIYETASWGISEQPDFLNQVLKIETLLAPEDVLKQILFIELEMGRKRDKKWGSRLIDIDILFYHDVVIDRPELSIPHPEFKKRNFALVPMAEIASGELHPETGETMAFLAENSKDPLPVRKTN